MTTPGGTPDAAAPEHVVDARGLRCPLPVVRLAALARDLAPGTVVAVLATDPAARHDVPAWARMRGHATTGEELVEPPDGDGRADDPHERWWRLTVRLGG
ncbi:tRNA 2-thiouridine synthesizing protein A [Isoptericola jiangsuensis]|uniref:tRNA 2-thiouridine synthesizing protein A n=1 Tax=Isoptericola jiangsuensis TaxID=548579 RepID=A0A2A9EYW3_9MICO|nr:sulfurtransferase TusA family protein [Isoptericola jiangsuensis]PFG43502.1 tRNA 2-thiouridine synthesizing protein A [Isoptericola jiangsuensis]